MTELIDRLKREVIDRFATDKALRDHSSVMSIRWHTPVVEIENFLLNNKPKECTRTVTSARTLTKREYASILKRWKNNLIGGSEEFSPDCTKRTWFPPENAQLFLLTRIEQEWNFESFEFYLLIQKNKQHFLAKRSGEENYLKVIDKRKSATYFSDALNSALSWKPN